MRAMQRLAGSVGSVIILLALTSGAAARSVPDRGRHATHLVAAMVCSTSAESLAPCTNTIGYSPGASGSYTFDLTNNSIEDDQVDLSCTPSGVVASCSVAPSVLVRSGTTARVSVGFVMATSGGSGTVKLTSRGLSTLTATLTIIANDVQVVAVGTPPGDLLPDSSYTQSFTVYNVGGTATSFALATACSGSVTCTLTTSSPLAIGGGQHATATVRYHTGAVGSSGVVGLRATDVNQSLSTTAAQVNVAVPAPQNPGVDATVQAGLTRNVALCIASCFDVVASYSTPAYVSMDVPRSATLVYSSAQAHPMGVVQVNAVDGSVRAPQKMSLQVIDASSRFTTFTNGSTELFFAPGTPHTYVRLAGQFDASGLATGWYRRTALARSYWTTGVDSGTIKQGAATINVVVVNEQGSPFGAGWSLAGFQHLYLAAGPVAVITDGAGSATVFNTPCTGCAFATPGGDFSRLTTETVGGVVTYVRTYRDGTRYSFSSTGNLLTVQDRFGNTVSYHYNGSGLLSAIVSPASDSLTFAYTNGKLSTITDAGGRVSRFTIDATTGNLTTIKDPTGATTFVGTYDASHRLIQRTDRAGNSWLYRYDFASKTASDSTAAVFAENVTQRLGTRYRSPETAELIDTASHLGSSAAPAIPLLRDSVRAVVVSTLGDSVRYAVDRFGAPTRIEQPSLKQVVTFARDTDSHVWRTETRVRGQLVDVATATWSGPRLMSQADSMSGLSATYTYDTTYDLVTLVSGSTQRTANYLNAAKKWVDSTRVGQIGGDTVWRFTHDARGRLLVTRDPRGDTTAVVYGGTGFQNTSSTVAGNRVTQYQYDNYGRVAAMTLPSGEQTTVRYDSLNRVRTQSSAPNGSLITYTYDSLYLFRVTDGKGQTYEYDRNALGWVNAFIDANTNDPVPSRAHLFYYNRAGLVGHQYNPEVQMTDHTYDAQGRLITRTLDDGRVTKFSYDTAGFWTADSSAEGIDTLKSSATGLVHYEITWRGGHRYVVTSSADGQGLLRTAALRTGTTTIDSVSYGYDANRRLDTLTVGTARTYFAYNTDGVVTRTVLPTGDTIFLDVTRLHRPSRVKYSRATLNARFGANYTRDTLDRVLSRTSMNGDTTWYYTYDHQGRLGRQTVYVDTGTVDCHPDPTGMDGQICTPSEWRNLVGDQLFTYDTIGNRTDLGAAYDPGNRLTQFDGYTMTYDLDGNIIHKSGNGLDQYFYWNSIDQLDSVSTNGLMVRFGYDGMGRRVRKSTNTETLWYIYSGQQVVLEVDSATGAYRKVYHYYPGVDAPHSVVENGRTYYYLAEPGTGSIVGLIDSTGGRVNQYRYEPFGWLESVSEGVANPLRFAGREYDSETGLYYNRARYYDPRIARFISQDPAGFSAG